jgi:sugar transferase (PEP-CTERM/EpsH1 system associated)
MATQPYPSATTASAVPLSTAESSHRSTSGHLAGACDTDRRSVVHVSLGTHVGGMEKLLVEFARFSDRSRFELAFLSLQQRGKLADDIERLQWPVVAFDKQAGIRPNLVLQLARQMRQMRADVVHTHNTAGFVYGVPAAALARVPRIIHTRHGQRFEASHRQTRLFRWLSRFVHRVVSVSEDGRQLTIGEGVLAERACTIRNGVDISRFDFVGANPLGRTVVVARLSPEKDVATLIRAVGIVNEMIGSRGRLLELDIVGDGTERATLQTLAQSLGLSNVIRFHGLRNDIPEVLAGASMFVLPSLTEGISLTLLEAMARGLPVVACRVGGNPEVVIDGSTGLLVPAGQPQSLASAMLRLHRDPGLAEQFGRRGRQRVEQEFCVQEMIRQYERLYADEVPS